MITCQRRHCNNHSFHKQQHSKTCMYIIGKESFIYNGHTHTEKHNREDLQLHSKNAGLCKFVLLLKCCYWGILLSSSVHNHMEFNFNKSQDVIYTRMHTYAHMHSTHACMHARALAGTHKLSHTFVRTHTLPHTHSQFNTLALWGILQRIVNILLSSLPKHWNYIRTNSCAKWLWISVY